MATSTSVLNITYPSEFEDPFHVSHATGMEELDEWLRIIWEEATLMVVGGGKFTLVGDTFSWDETIEIINPRTNKRITVAAGSITIADGRVAALTGVTRPMVNQALSAWEINTTGPLYDKTKLTVFRRSGSNVYICRPGVGLERVTVEV